MKASGRRSPLRIIGAFKLAKGLLLASVALGAVQLVHRDTAEVVFHFARRLHLDPEGRLVEPVLRRLSGVNPRAMLRFSLGALIYAALLLTEGIGLLMVQRWAEYLTIVITASLVPLEVYELARHPNVTRTTVLAVNLAIVIYLVVRVRRKGPPGGASQGSFATASAAIPEGRVTAKIEGSQQAGLRHPTSETRERTEPSSNSGL